MASLPGFESRCHSWFSCLLGKEKVSSSSACPAMTTSRSCPLVTSEGHPPGVMCPGSGTTEPVPPRSECLTCSMQPAAPWWPWLPHPWLQVTTASPPGEPWGPLLTLSSVNAPVHGLPISLHVRFLPPPGAPLLLTVPRRSLNGLPHPVPWPFSLRPLPLPTRGTTVLRGEDRAGVLSPVSPAGLRLF